MFGNYSKPGKGVTKNDQLTKSRFALYFEVLFRKFWDICLLNLILVLFMLPFLALSYGIMNLLSGTALESADVQLTLILIFSPFMFFGPFVGGACRIARDFAREEPVFIWSDFLSTVKKNIGQTLMLSILGYIGTAALTYALPAYYMMEGVMRFLLFPLCMVAALVFLFMQYYVYTMAVTFQLKLREILKNALIFSFISLFKNFLITLIILLVLALCIGFFALGISMSVFFGFLIILVAGFLLGFVLYSTNFIIYPSLKKYIIDPYYEKNIDKTSAALSKDNNSDEEPKVLPEYVYHNGRMVHRSVLEAETVFDDNLKGAPVDKKDDDQ